LLHHVSKVWAECVGANGFGESADCIHGNTTQLNLFTLPGQDEEMLEAIHSRLEVWQKLPFGRMSGTANGASDDRFDGNGSRV